MSDKTPLQLTRIQTLIYNAYKSLGELAIALLKMDFLVRPTLSLFTRSSVERKREKRVQVSIRSFVGVYLPVADKLLKSNKYLKVLAVQLLYLQIKLQLRQHLKYIFKQGKPAQ